MNYKITGAGAYPTLEEAARAMVRIRDQVTPNPDAHEVYRQLMSFYRDTHDALSPLMHRMAARSRASP